MYKGPRVAVYTGTRNIYEAMWGAAKSMLAVGGADEVWLFIEDAKFPFDTGDLPVHVRDVSGQRYFLKDGPNMQSGFTYMAMMRAVLAAEFPYLGRILALDCDAYAVRDCRGIWDLDLDANGGYYLAAAYEPERCKPGANSLKYCNIGVCLYNLDLLRSTGKWLEVVDVLNRRKFDWLEQDAFSFLCQGRILEMSSECNYCPPFVRKQREEDIVIRHFAGKKEWMKEKLAMAWTGMPVSEVKRIRAEVLGL